MRRLLIVLILALSAPAAAQAPRSAASRDELARIEAEQQAREDLRDQKRGDADAARREIAELSAQLAELYAAQGRGEQNVGARRLRLAALNVRETELATRMGANANKLSRLLGALQMFSKSPPPALLVNPRDAQDAVRAAILIRAVTPDLQRRADGFAAEAAEARKVRRQAAAEAGELFSAESDVADQAARIETLLAERRILERSLTEGAVIADRQAAELAARASALRAVVGALPTGRAAAETLEVLTPPVAGPPQGRFGSVEADGTRSEGWTWRAAAGPVVAPARGIVEYAGPVEGWSNVVIIAARDGHHIVLAGLDALSVSVGQSVAAGQTIGRMVTGGDMGLSSRPRELRLEIQKAGRPVDPARLMQVR